MCSNQVNIRIQIKRKGGTNETEEGTEQKVRNPVYRNTMTKCAENRHRPMLLRCGSAKKNGMMLTNWLT